MTLYFGKKEIPNVVVGSSSETTLTAQQLENVNADHSQYLTQQDLSDYALKSELFSGSYNDLTNKPTIPSVSGLASEVYVTNAIKDKADKSEIITSYNDLSDKPTIPAQVTDAHINSLIDAKLGVIENGSY